MTLKITTWSPDTCGCTVHYQWDDSLPSDQRIHIPVESVTTSKGDVLPSKHCEHHQKLDTVHDVHIAIKSENQKKNKAVAIITETFPEVAHEDVKWSFDKDRNLSISSEKLQSAAISFVQQRINDELGVDAVRINTAHSIDI